MPEWDLLRREAEFVRWIVGADILIPCSMGAPKQSVDWRKGPLLVQCCGMSKTRALIEFTERRETGREKYLFEKGPWPKAERTNS